MHKEEAFTIISEARFAAALFWPDLASAHYARDTINLLNTKGVRLVEKSENPPNCPQLRPIERYWGIIKRILRSDGRDITSLEDFKKMWVASSKKIKKKLCRT